MNSYRVVFYCHLINLDNEAVDSLEYTSLEELLEDWPMAVCDSSFSTLQYEVYV
jgi:hypothetical protein